MNENISRDILAAQFQEDHPVVKDEPDRAPAFNAFAEAVIANLTEMVRIGLDPDVADVLARASLTVYATRPEHRAELRQSFKVTVPLSKEEQSTEPMLN